MRIYSEQKETKLVEVICNCCGKKLLVENGFLKEECIHITHEFGFFGKSDGTSHVFDLCEECYEKIIAGFAVPAEVHEREELI